MRWTVIFNPFQKWDGQIRITNVIESTKVLVSYCTFYVAHSPYRKIEP